MSKHALFALLLAGALASTAPLPLSAASTSVVAFGDPDLPAVAAAIANGDWLRVEGVPLDGSGKLETLELQRFEVFSSDARIVIHGPRGDTIADRPQTRYLRGWLNGAPSSHAYLSIQPDGEVRGIVSDAGRHWVIGNVRASRRLAKLASRAVPDDAFAAEQERFSCATDNLGVEPGAFLRGTAVDRSPQETAGGGSYTARLAIETDNEFLNLFGGNTADATAYIGDLVAFSSGIYSAEVDTEFFITFISLWTGSDPWKQSSTACGMFEFGRYWNDNYDGSVGGDVYTLSHFMSGKSNGGGVGWVGVLCSPQFSWNHQGSCPGLTPDTDNYGGPYGYSGDLDGNFDLDNPAVVWDIIVVSHELGHNFDSPHTHCYAGLQGNANPIDECFGSQQGCYSGATSLPSGCPGGGMGCGTIMSYCHLLSPGISNIGFSLGTGHPYGIAPERVPTQIGAHLLATANSNPACLAPVSLIFSDGFESGATGGWTATVP